MTGGSVAGRRILVVEDEYFIASDLRRALARAGAAVLGPVATAEAGLALLAGGDGDAAPPPDIALLDVNLGGASSFAVADALSARGIPFLLLTGYDGWSLPPAYRDRPRLAKPYQMDALIETVASLLQTEHDA